MDVTIGRLRKQAEIFSSDFTDLLLTALELQGFFRIGTIDFPMANEHRRQVMTTLQNYSNYIKDLTVLIQQNRIPGTLTTLYVDRVYRMVCTSLL